VLEKSDENTADIFKKIDGKEALQKHVSKDLGEIEE
jgi:hypothetical protein